MRGTTRRHVADLAGSNRPLRHPSLLMLCATRPFHSPQALVGLLADDDEASLAACWGALGAVTGSIPKEMLPSYVRPLKVRSAHWCSHWCHWPGRQNPAFLLASSPAAGPPPPKKKTSPTHYHHAHTLLITPALSLYRRTLWPRRTSASGGGSARRAAQPAPAWWSPGCACPRP
jgi:hypothetical protein